MPAGGFGNANQSDREVLWSIEKRLFLSAKTLLELGHIKNQSYENYPLIVGRLTNAQFLFGRVNYRRKFG